jgi:lysozyme family protein
MSVPSTIKQGDEGPDVRWLQYCLTRITLEYRDIDGSFGPHTTAAVKEFQKDESLAVDGVVGPATWGVLRGGDTRPPTLSEGSHGSVVKELQTALDAGRGDITPASEPVLVVDGEFGAKTAGVVRGAQKVGAITHDGTVGLQTWALPLHAAGQVLADVCGVRVPGRTAP